MRRPSLMGPTMISIGLRRSSYLMGGAQDYRPRAQGVMPCLPRLISKKPTSYPDRAGSHSAPPPNLYVNCMNTLRPTLSNQLMS